MKKYVGGREARNRVQSPEKNKSLNYVGIMQDCRGDWTKRASLPPVPPT